MIWALAGVVVILNLGIGWLMGRFWSFRGTAMPALTRPEAYRIRELARGLAEHVADVHRDVKSHHGRVEQVSQGLLAFQTHRGDCPEESVLTAVSEILKINVGLQSRLMAAEEKLHDQSQQIESLMEHAWTDPLTGVPNRRAFDSALDRQIAEWERTGSAFSVIVVDADHFKAINDRQGHAAGDLVLRRLAELLEGTFRKMDLIARIGGEEFAVILPSTSGRNACRAAEHVREAVSQHEFQDENFRIRLTISLGVAEVASRDEAGSLLRRADQALYAAKQAGRNRTYLNEGQRCEPFRSDSPFQPAETPKEVVPKAQRDSQMSEGADMSAVCRSLRQSVAQIVEANA
jgi:diguanylate cyclase